MNQLVNGRSLGRTIAGCALGAAVALVSPYIMLMEILASLPLILLPSLALVFIRRWAGKAATFISGLFLLIGFGRSFGSTFMWIAFLLMINPLTLILKLEGKPFFAQLRSAIGAFLMGLIFSVVMLYLILGGGIIEAMMEGITRAVHSAPPEVLDRAVSGFAPLMGDGLDAAGLLARMDSALAQMAPTIQLRLPGCLFSGMLVTALFSVTLSQRMLKKAGKAAPGAYVPLSRWYLPASVSSGVFMMLMLSLLLSYTAFEPAQTLFNVVFDLAAWVFTVQALASMSRRFGGMNVAQPAKITLLAVFFTLACLGGTPFLAIYGAMSAIFGSRGLMIQRHAERMNQMKKKNSDHSDDQNKEE